MFPSKETARSTSADERRGWRRDVFCRLVLLFKNTMGMQEYGLSCGGCSPGIVVKLELVCVGVNWECELQGTVVEDMIGQEISVKLLELDEARDRIVCSARKPRPTAAVNNLQAGTTLSFILVFRSSGGRWLFGVVTK
jgi:hypothetical protein